MKLPIYTPQVAPTNEAPGRAFQVRRNANLEAQTQLSKGAPLSQALAEVNNITAVRINMARENLLNEAQLGLENELDKAFREFKQYGSPDTKFSGMSFNKILDGENPLWNARMEEIKGKVKTNLGKDKYMNNKFDLFFSQAEQSARLKIRSIVDTKVRAAAVEHRNMKLQKAEDDFSKPDDNLTAATRNFLFDQKMSQLVTDKNKLIKHGFKSDKLSAQETSLTLNTVTELLKNISVNDPNTDAASTVLDEIRTVVFPSKVENKDIKYEDLDENQKFAVRLLRKLKDPALTSKALSSVYQIATFAEAETTKEGKLKDEEKEKIRLQKFLADQEKKEGNANLTNIQTKLKHNFTDVVNQLILSDDNLHKVDIDDLEELESEINDVIPSILENEKLAGKQPKSSTAYNSAYDLRNKLVNARDKVESFQYFHSQERRDQQDQIIKRGSPNTKFGEEIGALWENELKEQDKAFENGDGLGFIVKNRNLKKDGNKIGTHKFERFDYNFILRDNEEGFKEWFENRSQLASYVHDRFHPLSALDETAVQYFTSEEIGIFKNIYDQQTDQDKMVMLETMVSAMGQTALDSVLDQMSLDPNLVVAARLLEYSEDNPTLQGQTSAQTAKFIIQGNTMAKNKKSLSWIDKSAMQDTLNIIESAFTDSAKQMIPEWNKAVQSYLLGRFSASEGIDLPTYTSEEKSDMTLNGLIYGFNQIFNAQNKYAIDSAEDLKDKSEIPVGLLGGFQDLNSYFNIFLPGGISSERVNQSLENITLDHINKSASRNADGSFLYADQPYFLKEEDIEDIKDNSDKYGFLRDAEGNYMMVRKHTQYGQQQPVLDRNEQVIYVDISIFSEETSIEIDKEKQIQKLKQQAEEMGF